VDQGTALGTIHFLESSGRTSFLEDLKAGALLCTFRHVDENIRGAMLEQPRREGAGHLRLRLCKDAGKHH
jgi:hypothetical protein